MNSACHRAEGVKPGMHAREEGREVGRLGRVLLRAIVNARVWWMHGELGDSRDPGKLNFNKNAFL